jgi:peroxiredoxin/predicted 2-oxoglutarate/Fe(II)-dependent dioxygenase YbiX
MAQRPPHVGEPAPWFVARSNVNPAFHFDTVAGRYVALTFFASAGQDIGRQVLDGFQAIGGGVFDGENAVLLAVSVDPEDERTARVTAANPDLPVLWDFDLAVSRLFGVADQAGEGQFRVAPKTYVLDPRLRVLGIFGVGDDPAGHAARVVEFVTSLPRSGAPVSAAVQAPILVVPHVFEPDLCRTLIQYYDDRGGEDSGYMVEQGGQTVGVIDHAHKRRRDREIEDEALRTTCMHRVHDRLAPEIHKAFQFRATRMERYIVACYEADTGGHFRPHRDNTTKGTAHRRFAVSLILNTGEFEGGHLRFPEYGPHLYSAPAGGAVVFSCSLLHEATPVSQGKRYVFLPFLYDDAAAKIREVNLRFVAGASPVPPPTEGGRD